MVQSSLFRKFAKIPIKKLDVRLIRLEYISEAEGLRGILSISHSKTAVLFKNLMLRPTMNHPIAAASSQPRWAKQALVFSFPLCPAWLHGLRKAPVLFNPTAKAANSTREGKIRGYHTGYNLLVGVRLESAMF